MRPSTPSVPIRASTAPAAVVGSSSGGVNHGRDGEGISLAIEDTYKDLLAPTIDAMSKTELNSLIARTSTLLFNVKGIIDIMQSGTANHDYYLSAFRVPIRDVAIWRDMPQEAQGRAHVAGLSTAIQEQMTVYRKNERDIQLYIMKKARDRLQIRLSYAKQCLKR